MSGEESTATLLDRVFKIHKENPAHVGACVYCDETYPCDTIRIAEIFVSNSREGTSETDRLVRKVYEAQQAKDRAEEGRSKAEDTNIKLWEALENAYDKNCGCLGGFPSI